jgi:hypothetical protein
MMQRIEPYGWDRQDRTYFVLDDNRLYRLTNASPPPPKQKKNTKKSRAAQRSSKRRRVSSGAANDADDAHDEASDAGGSAEPEDDGLGGMKWECLATTLDEVRQFLSTILKSKDANEKTLRDQIQDHLLPILEKQEESRKRKQLQREKELLNLEKMAYAKRSSRIAGKMEQQKMEEQVRGEERKRREEEAARRKEEQQQSKMERERNNRLMSREQRLKEREVRRRLHEEELAQLSEDSKEASNASARMSERRRLAEIERNKKALQELEEEEEDWVFDCVCGVYGHVDDGTHSVACERCNTWQHSKCLGIDEQEADQEDFHFICTSCRRREDAASDPHPRMIKIKVNRPQEPESPASEQAEESTATFQQPRAQLVVELQSRPSTDLLDDGSKPSRAVPSPSVQEPPALQSAQPITSSNSANNAVPGPKHIQESSAGQGNNPFSSPHPSLLPPGRQAVKSGSPNLAPGKLTHLPAGDGDGKTGLVAKSAVSGGVLSALAGSGSGGSSPSKQAHRPPSPPTKTSPSAPAASNGFAPSLSTENISSMTSSSMGLPHLTPAQSRHARSDQAASGSSPLPPPSGGLSPTKNSPPAPRPQQHINGVANPAATPLVGGAHPPSAVFPPVPALSPSPRQQILTPPVKPAEPVKVPPQQLPQGTQTPKLVASSPPRLDAPSS